MTGMRHEDHRMIGDTKIHFSDKEELLDLKKLWESGLIEFLPSSLLLKT